MEVNFKKMLYGGDYNPNQWPEEVWLEDMALFKKANINSASINIFSWSKIQPSEEEYDFEELDRIVDMLVKNDIDIVLATATAALPAWMFRKYPEVSRVDYEGRKHKFGQRHNHCPNSLVYQKYSERIAGVLAERYGHLDKVVCWHINNEYGGRCYCDNCEKAFRVWVKNRYGNLEAVNEAWNMDFWGHRLHSFDDIVLPNALAEGIGTEDTAFAGISIDYMRFNSDGLLENFKLERDAIRKHDKKTPITNNIMGTYKELDYFKWAKEMDIVSWDNYPAYDTPWSFTAMRHDLMRGLKQKPFMLMEQTPSQQNWQPYNSLKRPGQMRAQSYQTIAHGADTIQFFQLRRSKGACEKFHGAVISHEGSENTRVFREVSQLGKELDDLKDSIIGADNPSDVGIIFDWDNYWALEYTSGPNKDLKYVDQIHQYYEYFYDNNISVDMIARDGDFSKYKLIVAPVLYMVHEGIKEALEAYVEAGGILVTGFMSGIVNESDNVYLGGYPGPLRELAGVWVEEIDALAPEQFNRIKYLDGEEYTCNLLCDIMHLEGAKALAHYSTDFYKDTPVISKNDFGKGQVFYVGTQVDKEGLAKVLDIVSDSSKLSPVIDEKTALEVTVRRKGDSLFYFIINLTDKNYDIPKCFIGEKDLLTGKVIEADIEMKPYDVRLVESKL